MIKTLNSYILEVAAIYDELFPETQAPTWLADLAKIAMEKKLQTNQIKTVLKDAVDIDKQIQHEYRKTTKNVLEIKLNHCITNLTEEIF